MRQALAVRRPRRPIARSARHETDENPRPIPLTAPLADAHENKIDAIKCLEKRSSKLCFRCLRSCRKDPMRTATPRPKNAIEHDKIPACPPLRSVIFAQISPKPPLCCCRFAICQPKKRKSHIQRPLKKSPKQRQDRVCHASKDQISASITVVRRVKRALKSQKTQSRQQKPGYLKGRADRVAPPKRANFRLKLAPQSRFPPTQAHASSQEKKAYIRAFFVTS